MKIKSRKQKKSKLLFGNCMINKKKVQIKAILIFETKIYYQELRAKKRKIKKNKIKKHQNFIKNASF